MKIGDILTLTIDKLTFGGDGLGRRDGVVFFVPFSAPGDVLEVKITALKKNFYRAEISKILTPSPLRVEAKCEYFGRCGGCQWQHISYPQQVSTKELLVKENIKSFFTSKTEWHEIHSSPHQWNYRNRIQLKIVNNKVGYFEFGTHNLIEVSHCEIAEEPLSKAITGVAAPARKTEPIERVELSLNADLEVQKNWNYSASSPTAFSQVNRWQNETLIATVLKWLEHLKFDLIVDLYAGQGNFTFPMANAFKKETWAVEYNAKSVALAQQKIEHEKLRGIKFYSGDVSSILRTLSTLKSAVVVLDPPRAGCDSTALRYLLHLRPQSICYISCDPTTLKRDLAVLLASGEYYMSKATAFDMFPQTHHVESMVLLERNT